MVSAVKLKTYYYERIPLISQKSIMKVVDTVANMYPPNHFLFGKKFLKCLSPSLI